MGRKHLKAFANCSAAIKRVLMARADPEYALKSGG
jgi:hypothetical protein